MADTLLSDQIDDTTLARYFISSHRLGVLSTKDSNGPYPLLSFVYYILGTNNTFFVLTTKGSKKVENIARDPHVSFAVADEKDAQEMQIRGMCQLVTDPKQKVDIIQGYSEKANASEDTFHFPSLTQLHESELEFLQVHIESYRYSDFHSGKKKVMLGSDPLF